MIDKVARMRVLHARFGIDHSEILNYEIEQTNKPRDQHLNKLVYQIEPPEVDEDTTLPLSEILSKKLQI